MTQRSREQPSREQGGPAPLGTGAAPVRRGDGPAQDEAAPPRPRAEPRERQKARTRRAILDAALRLLGGERSFTSLSLRELTKEAGLSPAAFYRHFDTMEALGLALVDESFATLRRTMRDIRTEPAGTSHLVRTSVDTFLGYVLTHEEHFRFIAKERYGGSTTLRTAIRQEVRLFTSELATDLARWATLTSVSTGDLQLLAGLVVQAVMFATELTLDTDPDDDERLAAIADDATRQLLMVLVGMDRWRSES
ncbi:HTH-type transcriptional repressor FabR [Dermatobacter hominis]|uniref:HTH-type transcriptional repressor FabR n=1 Tax=Dermatobacter hominis TaxID=2884263 RepID=UPI001D0FC645|nr:HTH-type transcriptional repressor FabR [Dermatobacter hominis]UDY34697.1 HTH-type transcriptional repressor FabR [Dermatobacter hominis]